MARTVTFSDSRVVKMLQNDFVPVWESVAPVKTVTFDLGEGRSLKGTVSGEIAVYFCTPEGLVFDILPALQSPAATLATMKEALAFYQAHAGKLTDELVKTYHLKRMQKLAGKVYDRETNTMGAYSFGDELTKTAIGLKKREDYISEAVDEATRDMRTMSGSKVKTVGSTEEITIVEPGGQGYFQWEVDRRFVNNVLHRVTIPGIPKTKPEGLSETAPKTLPLKTPAEWKKELFEVILKQPLKGGEVTYDSSSLEAIRIIGE